MAPVDTMTPSRLPGFTQDEPKSSGTLKRMMDGRLASAVDEVFCLLLMRSLEL